MCEGRIPQKEGAMEERNQPRTHVFAINSSVEFLNVVRELLQEEGYAVTTTNYVPDTFEGIAALHPDVLVVDVAVGQQAGWELLERLSRARKPAASRWWSSRPIRASSIGHETTPPATDSIAIWKSPSRSTHCWPRSAS